MESNRIRLLEEEIWAIHTYLDTLGVPKENDEGRVYSIIGRIKRMEVKYLKQMSVMESSTVPTQN